MTQISSRKVLFIILVIAMLVMLLPACTSRNSVSLNMMSLDRLPDFVLNADINIQQAYQFAAANPDVMKQIPCYCGCARVGHISNYDCYVSGTNEYGSLVFDRHATACSICVKITTDVMHLLGEGKAVPEIRAYVDSTYSSYGPSGLQ